MAKQMTYDAPDGQTYPQSYWVPAYIALDRINRVADVVFIGYPNQTIRETASTRPIAPIGSKSYGLREDAFDTYFGVVAASTDQATITRNITTPTTTGGSDIVAQSYQVAMETLDTNEMSFFASASDV